MNKRACITTFLAALLCLTAIGSVWAQTRIPGVYQGNTFTYDVSAVWSSTDPSAVVPAELLSINQTEYYRVTIAAVSGAEITTQTVWHFYNGTETTSIGTINVETGVTNGGFWAIVAGNLGVNDRLHPSGPNYITVNATVMREYLGGSRETNHLILTLEGSDSGGDYIEHVDYYFDKQTGMLVQLSDAKVYSNPTVTITRLWKIKESNVWVVPEFPSVLILPLLMAIIMMMAIVYKKKNASIAKTLIPS
ncbi:MAG: hypothetical protein NWE94_02285 [Candidatus Bathyarchaeota archaeon]|nr:hypothetical protein [Candidatus Bathyarchaeota archaeon]